MGKELQNRPLLILALGLIIGLTVREHLVNLLFLVPLFLIASGKKPWIALGIGSTFGVFLSPILPGQGIAATQYVQGEARVVSIPRLYPDIQQCEIEVDGHRLSMTADKSQSLSFGDTLRVEGLASPLKEGMETFFLHKRIVGRFKPSKIETISEGPSWIRSATEVRKNFVDFTKATLTKDQAAMVDSLCFNVEGGLSDETKDKMQGTGTIHIISASGLHIFVIVAALDWILGLLSLPRPMRILGIGLFLAFYATAAGLQPAILRSALMSLLAMTAYLWQRENDLLSALSLAAILYLLVVPIGVYDMGFQLSFLTVAAFSLFGRLKEDQPKKATHWVKSFLVEAGQTSMVAFLATVPIVFYYFDMVALLAVPANILIAPAVMAEVILGLGAFVLGLIWPSAGQAVMSGVVGPVAQAIDVSLQVFPDWTVRGAFFSAYWLVLFYAIAMFCVRERVRPA